MIELLGDKLTDKSLAEESLYTEKINTCVSQTAEQTRNLAIGLHPVDLDKNGLNTALQKLADNTEHLFNISCTMKCEEVIRIDDISKAINLYRNSTRSHHQCCQTWKSQEYQNRINHRMISDNYSSFRRQLKVPDISRRQ